MAQNADKTLNRCAETGKCHKNITQEPPYNLLYKYQNFFFYKYDMRESTAFEQDFRIAQINCTESIVQEVSAT